MKTAAELLAKRAEATPERLAYGFLEEGERPGATRTCGDLAAAAGRVAAALRAVDARGGRALLLFAPGLELADAIWGAFAAGWTALPAPLPSPLRVGKFLPRLVAIGRDAEPAAILTTRRFLAQAGQLAEALGPAAPRVLAIDTLEEAPLELASGLDGDGVALLQYTSGSTASPRAAVIRHRHLLDNLRAIDACQRNDAESVGLSWLPVFHDLGLVAGLLHAFWGGYPGWSMAPAAFLQRPARWLEAIGLLRATNSGGPNFAFDLCVARIAEEQRSALDLRSWRYAHLGGETVRAGTLQAFARAFAPCGFDRRALRPGYGLAEATLLVTAGPRGAEPTLLEVSRRALAERHLALPPEGEADAVALVGCGAPVPGVELAIVDPQGLTLGEGEVGEVWVRGPSVAAGYWRRPDEAAATFGARLAAGEGPYLRTGDLGFRRGGELFLTGRQKDLIVVRGANHYPQDLERTAEHGEPRLQPGGAAAFALEGEGGEGVGLVAEVAPDFRARAPGAAGLALIESLRERLTAEHEVPVLAIVLVEPGQALKTTSGKIRRQATRAAFLTGGLPSLQEWRPPVPAGAGRP